MPQRVGKVEFHAGPDDLGAPDNLETVIIDFIDGTQKRLEIAVQELESRPIAETIIRARQRKVLVKLTNLMVFCFVFVSDDVLEDQQ